MSTRQRRGEEFPHLPLHLVLLAYVVVTLYPILWVFTIAFSGKQSPSASWRGRPVRR